MPVTAFVKGGTTSSAWDEQKKRQYAEADARRAHQDHDRRVVAASAGVRGVKSAILSLQLGSSQNPAVVLTYKAKDSALDQDCVAELIEHPRDDEPQKMGRILVLVCPECLKRVGRQDDSQTMVKSWHREFWIDETKAGTYVHPETGIVRNVAGTVTTRDLCSCVALGCNWKFRIDDSKLYGSHHFKL